MHNLLLPLIPLTLAGAIFFKHRAAAYGLPVLLIAIKAFIVTSLSPIYLFLGAGLLVSVFAVRSLGLRKTSSLLELTGYAAGTVLIYQLFSGFGVWFLGGCVPQDPPLYAHTAAGLAQCYAASLPGLVNTLLRDVPVTVLLVLAMRWVERKVMHRLDSMAAGA